MSAAATTRSQQEIDAIITSFRDAMRVAGVPCSEEIIADDDKINRFTVDGDRKKSLTGWYILHTDGNVPAGEFGCWKRGIQTTWCAKAENTLTPQELSELAAKRAADKVRREKQREADYEAAAVRAKAAWDAAAPAPDDHPYLIRKGVRAHGLRIGRWTREDGEGRVWLDVPDALLVPLRRGKRVVSLQAIFPSKDNPSGRDKDFLSGGRKRGCYFSIGKPDGDQPTIAICEGYATGATVHEIMGWPVLVAFDAGNLESVALKARELFRNARIIIAADNDRWTTSPVVNPGVAYGGRAAQVARAELRVPEFADLTDRPTDFNDLAAMEGSEAVRLQLDPPPAVEGELAEEPAPALMAANDNVPDASIASGYDLAAVDWYSPFPDCGPKGKPIATIENLREGLRRLRVTVRYNVISKEVEILIPGVGFSTDNEGNAAIGWLMSACARFGIPDGKLESFLCYLADQNQYNPVANWITSRPWDGTPRLVQLFDTIKAEGEGMGDANVQYLKECMMLRWMISAVAAAFEPNGVSAHGVLVLQGEQYLGKTKWFKSLVPESLGVIQDGMSLRPDDRDSVKQAVGFWLVELGELDATFRKADIAALKAFLTRKQDVLRTAYARRESKFARRTVFFASVNPRQFLHDPTGNRRYWTISCTDINSDHGLDVQQIWAEVYECYYRKGESWFLTKEEHQLLNSHNKDYEVLDPIKERLLTRYDWDAHEIEWRWKTATDVMQEIGFDKPSRADVTQCGQVLQELNGGRSKRGGGKNLQYVPPKIASSTNVF